NSISVVKSGYIPLIYFVPMITKPCPFCGKLITLHALMCPHCQTVNPFVKAVKRERFKNVCLTAIAITLAGVVIWFSF
ncbi:hypothetical protein NPI27_001502, partial [Citrobacter freundii]